jgi:hypothetical protein
MGNESDRDGFDLLVAAVDVLGERCGVDLHVLPFEIPHVGVTDAQRREVSAAVLRDLDQRGLARRGRLEPEVQDALMLLGRAPVSAALVGAARGDRPGIAARVASNGQQAVLAVSRGERLRISWLRPTGVVGAVMALVPAAPPVAGRSVTFPVDDGAETGQRRDTGRHHEDDAEGSRSVLRSGRPSTANGYARERDMARRLSERPRRRAGTVIVFRRDRHGRERRSDPVVWHDTDAGRYLIYVSVGSDGRRWVTYAPADHARLAQQLGQVWSAETPPQ